MTECCTACGAVLSRYRDPGETLCAPCRRKAAAARPARRVLDDEDCFFLVAGVLFLARVLRPGQALHLRAELAGLGVEADHVDVFRAVQKLRRRGCVIETTPREAGHRLVAWRYRFTRRTGPAARAAFWRRRQPALFRL